MTSLGLGRACAGHTGSSLPIARTHHGRPPVIAQWALGIGGDFFDELDERRAELTVFLDKLKSERRAKHVKEAATWARLATLAELHRASKPPISSARKTASGHKDHQGEATDYAAAVHGSKEWGGLWDASESDLSEDIMAAVEALTHVKAEHSEIELPPFDEGAIWRHSRKFKGATGLSTDVLRPWHIAMLSRGGRNGLCRILSAIEACKRWPDVLRWVSSVALGKRTGGARLIGISSTIYRLWARIRYQHCRSVLESRIERPFFAAAPHRGAERTAFDASLAAEAAAARSLHTAASSVDMKKCYENITVAEYAQGAHDQGVPAVVIALTAHLYTGPRLIRVRRAVAPPVYPRKSIVAGCTWATVFVRTMMVKPLDVFVKTLCRIATEWAVKSRVIFYIDDGVLLTTGEVNGVAYVHRTATRLLVDFITRILHKPIARDKLVCVASSAILRRSLKSTIGADGFDVAAEGEILGVDFAPGRGGRTGLEAERPLPELVSPPQADGLVTAVGR